MVEGIVGNSVGDHSRSLDPNVGKEAESSAGGGEAVVSTLYKIMADLTTTIERLAGSHENCPKQNSEQGPKSTKIGRLVLEFSGTMARLLTAGNRLQRALSARTAEILWIK